MAGQLAGHETAAQLGDPGGEGVSGHAGLRPHQNQRCGRRPPHACARLGLDGPSQVFSSPSTAHASALDQLSELAIASEAVSLRARFDPRTGQFGVTGLVGADTHWVAEAAAGGGLWIDGIRVADGLATWNDGNGLELVDGSPTSLTLRHGEIGLLITLEYLASPGNAITHRVSLTNGRSAGAIQVGSAATLALRLQAGDWTEGLAISSLVSCRRLVRISPSELSASQSVRFGLILNEFPG